MAKGDLWLGANLSSIFGTACHSVFALKQGGGNFCIVQERMNILVVKDFKMAFPKRL